MSDFKIPIPDEIKRLQPYVPGKPIEELERELGISGACKLASNENPLGPSKQVLKAIEDALKNIHRYPDGSSFRLRRALATHLKVDANQLILGNGSNELIVLLVECLVRPGDEVLFANPSFVVYPLITQALNGKAVAVPLKEDTHDLSAFEKALTSRTKIVFICNPNNPTGTIIPLSTLRSFLTKVSSHVLVVLDEAYFEYVSDPAYFNSLELLKDHANLVILRTFSKVYGLAGLRCGYGVAHPELAEAVQKTRQPFNVNSLAQTAAETALLDQDHVKKVVELNSRLRGHLSQRLTQAGFQVASSQANFVYFHIPHALSIYDLLLHEGVIVRPMGPNALRVTTGTQEETDRFLSVFEDVMKKRS